MWVEVQIKAGYGNGHWTSRKTVYARSTLDRIRQTQVSHGEPHKSRD